MRTQWIPMLVLCGGGSFAIATVAFGQCVESCIAIHDWVGESPGDQFGWVSNDVGDLDGDLIHDLVITAPSNAAGGTSAGRIYVYSGAGGEELFRATGSIAFGTLGHDAGSAGDVSGDGVPDLIVGSPGGGTGRAFVYSGTSRTFATLIHTFFGENPGDRFGARVHGGGDFNGDSIDDVIIGASQHDTAGADAGRAYIYSGDDFSLICSIDGLAAGHRFGSGVAFVGDINDDGRDDVVIGAEEAGPGGGGRAYVYSWDGKACQFEYELDPGSPAFDFGLWFMNGGHDVNADGTPDIYVNDFSVNRAHVFDGEDGSLIWSLNGDGRGGFGIGRLVEDVDGDGSADLILAAWDSDLGASSAGKAFVYSGATGGILDEYTHNVPNAQFGFDANGMGDVNGDDRYDYLITAAWDSGQTGRAYLIAGEITPHIQGDLDGDGDVDFTDLLNLLGAWGTCLAFPECFEDIDGSGAVDFADLLILLSNWT